jgi:hypothetical protein
MIASHRSPLLSSRRTQRSPAQRSGGDDIHPTFPNGALFASKIPLKEAGFSQRQPDQFQ